jgi:hypothetical protein
MRLNFHTAVPAAISLVGLVSALSAPASASETDPASAIRGSLGVSLDDLAFSSGAGATVFLMNAGFALLFAAVCIAVRRADSRTAKHLAFRAGSKFAR